MIAQCDFEEGDLLIPYIDEVVSHYFTKIDYSKGFNVKYLNPLIRGTIIPRIHEIVETNFDTEVIDNPYGFYLYVQNNQHYKSVFHNHRLCKPGTTDSSITTTFYLQLPKQGGGFEICTTPGNMEHNKQFDLQESTLYIFPSWLYHRPMPQQDSEYRICFNYDVMTTNRPKFIPGNVVW